LSLKRSALTIPLQVAHRLKVPPWSGAAVDDTALGWRSGLPLRSSQDEFDRLYPLGSVIKPPQRLFISFEALAIQHPAPVQAGK
jgi:hypothetical protein